MCKDIAHETTQLLLNIPVQVANCSNDFFRELNVSRDTYFPGRALITSEQTRRKIGGKDEYRVVRSVSCRGRHLAISLYREREVRERRQAKPYGFACVLL